MMLLRNIFSSRKAKIYLLLYILISFVIYIVYNYSLKQSNNEFEKIEERLEIVVKDLENQHKDENKYKDLENKLISRNHIEAANSRNLLDLSTKEEGERKAPNYHFTANWFGPNRPQWQNLITEFKGKEINVLEIGVFEGRSTIWMLENLFDNPKSVLFALDTFKGGVEHTGTNTSSSMYEDNTIVEQLEQTFVGNIEESGFKKQVEIMKGMSYDSLIKLNYDKRQFDFIYIDGSHNANDVLADSILAWPLLKVNGIMIFDDYVWQWYKEEYNNPKIAIDAFLACYAFEIEKLIENNGQIAIRKVKKERPYTRL